MATPNYLSSPHYRNQLSYLESDHKDVTMVSDAVHKSIASAFVRGEKGQEEHLLVVHRELSNALDALTNAITELKKLERIGQ